MNSRKLLAILTAAIMMVSVMATAALAFSDVPATHEAADSFGLLKGLKIYQGYPDGTAGPNNPITRAEFAAIVVRMLGREKLAIGMAAYTPSFPDAVPAWAWGYVNVATALQIMQGYPDGTFGADRAVTFAEAFAMLARALKLDKAAIGPWPFNYIMLAHEIGLDIGLDPVAGLPITRAEMAIAARNALIARCAWDKDDEEIVAGLSLLEKTPYSWSADDVSDIIATLTGATSGKVTKVLPLSKRVEIGGKEYTYVDGIQFWLNKLQIATGDFATAAGGLENLKTNAFTVTASFDTAGRVIKVAWTRSFSNKLVTAATVTTGETAYGTYTIDGVEFGISPDGPELWVNGAKATVAQLKAALDALRAIYGAGAHAAATIRTGGHKTIADSGVPYYLDVRTDKRVTGVVTALGSDASGAFFRITVDGASQKYYYTGITPTVSAASATFLLSPTNVAVQILSEVAAPVGVFWGRVTSLETDGSGNLIVLSAHTSKMAEPAISEYRGKTEVVSGVTVYQTLVSTTYVGPNKVAAFKLTTAGRVDLIKGYGDGTLAVASFVGTDTPQSKLHYGTAVSAVNLVGGLNAVQVSAGTEGAQVVLATDDVVILRSTGALSTAHTLATLRASGGADKIAAVFYVEKGGLRTAQIIQLKTGEL